LEENQEHNHEEFENEEAPVKPLWEVKYWNGSEERVEIGHVFGCSFPCAVDQAYLNLSKKFGDDEDWDIIGINELFEINILNLEFAQYEENEEDCEINAGLVEGDQGDGFFCKRCESCNQMNKFPSGMPSFICSRCKTKNILEK